MEFIPPGFVCREYFIVNIFPNNVLCLLFVRNKGSEKNVFVKHEHWFMFRLLFVSPDLFLYDFVNIV